MEHILKTDLFPETSIIQNRFYITHDGYKAEIREDINENYPLYEFRPYPISQKYYQKSADFLTTFDNAYYFKIN